MRNKCNVNVCTLSLSHDIFFLSFVLFAFTSSASTTTEELWWTKRIKIKTYTTQLMVPPTWTICWRIMYTSKEKERGGNNTIKHQQHRKTTETSLQDDDWRILWVWLSHKQKKNVIFFYMRFAPLALDIFLLLFLVLNASTEKKDNDEDEKKVVNYILNTPLSLWFMLSVVR